MVRLIGKNKSVLKSAGSISAGNKSANDLLVLLEGLATGGSITGVWNMNELYNSVVNSNWIDDLTADTSRAQAGGTMTVNSVSLGSYDYTYIGGDENITSFSNGNYFTSTADSRSALIYVDGDLTIASGQTFIPSNRKLFTAIYVKGNLDVDGTISMTARGANHSPSGSPYPNSRIQIIADGTYSGVPNPHIPAGGGPGGAQSSQAYSESDHAGNNGNANTAGGTGGGGGGGAGVGGNNNSGYSGTCKGGAGAQGTSFSGGPGGGGATDLTSPGTLNADRTGSNGIDKGGAGGAASTQPSHYHAHGGSGNPGGQGHNAPGPTPANNGTDGTGGVLIIYVEGNYTGSGTVEAKGAGGKGHGGASGGGTVTIFVKGSNSGPTPSAAGGANLGGAIDSATGGVGGAGTARILAYT